MLDWRQIDTVLLDMDGTLLDLHFDNYFWLEHLPERWAAETGQTADQAKAQLKAEYDLLMGKLEWYCLDYWANRTGLAITELKREIQHKIRMRDDSPAFLTALRQAGKQVILVTNAHPDSLSLKIEQTELASYIDTLVSVHEFGYTKEQQPLWQLLQQKYGFDTERTLFVDDSLPVLRSAQQFGIRHLLAITNPDSQQPARIITEFPAIDNYAVLLDDLTAA
ncbi:GMP/IMP nucleotidase [Rheinheimera sp.]|uniref:GMP/IMP nucleotidase n=1 Tax=Rheinheimera sp. TaxID=1869214 RepID=UPI00307CF48C